MGISRKIWNDIEIAALKLVDMVHKCPQTCQERGYFINGIEKHKQIEVQIMKTLTPLSHSQPES